MRPKKNQLLLGMLFLTITVFGQQQNPKYLAYIEQFKSIAIREMQRLGIPASITMAQGLVESGAGQSELARNAHNHFGIKKGGNWTETVVHSFCSLPNCADGSQPNADPIMSHGALYGTTNTGPNNAGGTVFKLTP